MSDFEVNITQELKRFNFHINPPSNSRIFFSGIFGIGKTYFLKEFFADNEDYEEFFLRPVNYSIAQNEDIVDYIKYDILFELLGKEIDFEKAEFSKKLTAQLYFKENFTETILILLKMTGKIGKPIADIIEGIKTLSKNIDNHPQDIQADQKKEATDFLKTIIGNEGSIYHEDRITDLISSLLWSLKESNEVISDKSVENESREKKTVLIIDDLDRLDPEHIFRILNVFACHFDLDSGVDNKFGFDKIIVVGDEENIRNIFQAKYGINTDFNGYLDKFFSTEIYHFDNKTALLDDVYSFFPKFKIGNNRPYLKNTSYVLSRLFIIILNELISQDLLNLRIIKSALEREHSLENFSFKKGSYSGIFFSNQMIVIHLFQLLSSIYGSHSSLEIVLKKLIKRKPFKMIKDKSSLEPLLCLIDYKNHNGIEGEKEYLIKDYNIKINYSINGTDYDVINLLIGEILYVDNLEKNVSDFPFALFLYLAFQEFLNLDRGRN